MIIFDMEAVPREDMTEQLILFRQSHLEMKALDGRLTDPVKKAENIIKVDEANHLIIKHFRDRDGTDVDYAQIIAIGMFKDNKYVIGTTEKNTELVLIEKFASSIAEEKGPVIGYNIQGYDTPLLKRRCMYYGIPFPPVMKYKPIDIMWELSEWKRVKSKKLIEVAMALGYEIKMDISSGADVYPNYVNGNWQLIKDHLEQDLKLTEFVYTKLINSKILDETFKGSLSGYNTAK